jgi:electron transport complex protein RnfG
MNAAVRLIVILFVICALSAGALALVDSATRTRIQANQERKESLLRGSALVGEQKGSEVSFDAEPITVEGVPYYVGRLDSGFAGVAFTVVTDKGYAGPIEIVIAIEPTGDRIAGVRIKSHSETPGLGANAAQVKYGDIEPWFLAQFKGLIPQQAQLKKDSAEGEIDAITAATITSRAVTNAVHDEAVKFQNVWDSIKEQVHERSN